MPVEIPVGRPIQCRTFGARRRARLPLSPLFQGHHIAMINVAAIRMQQFGVQFYQASLTAKDIDKLVRFEVLSYADQAHAPVRGGRRGTGPKINWDLLERRIASSDRAYQRQIIRRKIDELVQYYEQCRQARDLPSIPGAVIISCDEKLKFEPVERRRRVGTLQRAGT